MSDRSESLAQEIRSALGPHDNPRDPVIWCVRALRDRFDQIDSELRAAQHDLTQAIAGRDSEANARLEADAELAQERGLVPVFTAHRTEMEAKLARVSRAGVLSVLAELDRARAKFPTWPTDPLHALAVLGEEYGELTRAVLQRCYGDEGRATEVEAEAVQVAAMALRFLASLDEYEYREGSQHRDDEQEAGSDE